MRNRNPSPTYEDLQAMNAKQAELVVDARQERDVALAERDGMIRVIERADSISSLRTALDRGGWPVTEYETLQKGSGHPGDPLRTLQAPMWDLARYLSEGWRPLHADSGTWTADESAAWILRRRSNDARVVRVGPGEVFINGVHVGIVPEGSKLMFDGTADGKTVNYFRTREAEEPVNANGEEPQFGGSGIEGMADRGVARRAVLAVALMIENDADTMTVSSGVDLQRERTLRAEVAQLRESLRPFAHPDEHAAAERLYERLANP